MERREPLLFEVGHDDLLVRRHERFPKAPPDGEEIERVNVR
jgi:hypothetical protein